MATAPRSPARAAYAVVTGLALAVLLWDRLGPALPTTTTRSAAVVVATAAALALGVRTGGRASWAAGLTLLLGVAAVLVDWAPLVAGAAAGAGVVVAVTAVMSTRPARTLPAAAREAAVALLVAEAGSLAVAGFGAPLSSERATPAVLVAALVSALVVVLRLGAGWHGLGPRGYAAALVALAVLVVAVVYEAAFEVYGSPRLVEAVARLRADVTDALGAAPHPLAFLVGVPALMWGSRLRDRRRAGWWVTAFGAAATAGVTTRLLHEPWTEAVLGEVYGLLLGVLVGAVGLRVAMRPSRARLLVASSPGARRDEPGRFSPLA